MENSNIYADAISAYLGRSGVTQDSLANKAGASQSAICRYAAGDRFPDRATADRLHEVSAGEVPISLWRIVAAERAGLAT